MVVIMVYEKQEPDKVVKHPFSGNITNSSKLQLQNTSSLIILRTRQILKSTSFNIGQFSKVEFWIEVNLEFSSTENEIIWFLISSISTF